MFDKFFTPRQLFIFDAGKSCRASAQVTKVTPELSSPAGFPFVGSGGEGWLGKVGALKESSLMWGRTAEDRRDSANAANLAKGCSREAKRQRSERVLVVHNKYNLTSREGFSMQVLDNFRRAGRDVMSKVLPCGHYTTGKTPDKFIDGWYLGYLSTRFRQITDESVAPATTEEARASQLVAD
jgi:hypothetical protein